MYQSVLADVRLYELLLRLDEDLGRVDSGEGLWVVRRTARPGGLRPQAARPAAGAGGRARGAAELVLRRRGLSAPDHAALGTLPGTPRLRGSGGRGDHGVAGRGARRAEVRELRAWLGVSARTLARWRRWWRTAFAESRFWRSARGQLRTPVPVRALPGGLLQRFAGDLQTRLIAGLRFLAPLTTAAGAM